MSIHRLLSAVPILSAGDMLAKDPDRYYANAIRHRRARQSRLSAWRHRIGLMACPTCWPELRHAPLVEK